LKKHSDEGSRDKSWPPLDLPSIAGLTRTPPHVVKINRNCTITCCKGKMIGLPSGLMPRLHVCITRRHRMTRRRSSSCFDCGCANWLNCRESHLPKLWTTLEPRLRLAVCPLGFWKLSSMTSDPCFVMDNGVLIRAYPIVTRSESVYLLEQVRGKGVMT
jgi:hypothetical protein